MKLETLFFFFCKSSTENSILSRSDAMLRGVLMATRLLAVVGRVRWLIHSKRMNNERQPDCFKYRRTIQPVLFHSVCLVVTFYWHEVRGNEAIRSFFFFFARLLFVLCISMSATWIVRHKNAAAGLAIVRPILFLNISLSNKSTWTRLK